MKSLGQGAAGKVASLYRKAICGCRGRAIHYPIIQILRPVEPSLVWVARLELATVGTLARTNVESPSSSLRPLVSVL
jgi:lipoate-protein ligase B